MSVQQNTNVCAIYNIIIDTCLYENVYVSVDNIYTTSECVVASSVSIFHTGPTSAGGGTSVMDVVTVPVLSAVVGILVVILIASIVVIAIVAVSGCVHVKRKNTGGISDLL